MGEFKMCNDGEFMPVSLPCPPPYSGPYYYYPYDNIPFPPPAQGSFNNYENNGGSDGGDSGGAPISAGAVAGIIILMSLIIVMLCLFAIRFRTRLFGDGIVRHLGTRNARNRDLEAAGDLHASANSGDVLLTVVGGGLEEKLVNLLPVYEYVRFQDEGKQLLNVQKKVEEEGRSCTECAVCLSLFEEKDIVRILPKCKHVFHLLCIDKWFESHANCPLCRERITLQTIQRFLENSEDRAPHGDANQGQQLEEFDACQEGDSQLHNHGTDAVDNCPAAMGAYDDQCHQQERELAVATCVPRDNIPIHDLQPSAADNNDGPQIGGYHATNQYLSGLVDNGQYKDSLSRRHASTSLPLQSYENDEQAFSFPVAHHATIEGDKDCLSSPDDRGHQNCPILEV
ncbi:hypothetical protein GOP47_0011880 [Adiantum capillus-veneris]|uniref:RING-type E3 ubiquitin transferase n=1 Tax=Adiantum capillus-veneris TaxID=13818 RepID=A0A9D4ZH72_ADICA|nr:hypothetical protein GOP47_0011880 [Adiantum capillus-veneris]